MYLNCLYLQVYILTSVVLVASTPTSVNFPIVACKRVRTAARTRFRSMIQSLYVSVCLELTLGYSDGL